MRQQRSVSECNHFLRIGRREKGEIWYERNVRGEKSKHTKNKESEKRKSFG